MKLLEGNFEILDISPVISQATAVWPGDTPFRQEFSSKMSKGQNIDLSSITTTVHIGAHVDAPSHFSLQGASIERVSLNPYIGPAQILEVNLPRGERIRPHHIKDSIRAPRILIKTGSFPISTQFNRDFNSLSGELVEFLTKMKCTLVGIDTPSVDPFDDKVLESHQALSQTGLRNIEGLDLSRVPIGLYTLIALPLPIHGADASPVRAVLLRTIGS